MTDDDKTAPETADAATADGHGGELEVAEQTEDEQREAEALARALERGHAAESLPEQALQTAALLRYSADGGALDSERSAAILEELLQDSEAIASRRPSSPARSPWLRWALGAFGLAAAAVLAVFLMRPRPSLEATTLPTPPAALLNAQMQRLVATDGAASPDEAGLHESRFDDAMHDYRSDVLESLAARYEAR